MATKKKYRWRDNKGNRRPDQFDGPVRITGHVPAIPKLTPQERREVLKWRKTPPSLAGR